MPLFLSSILIFFCSIFIPFLSQFFHLKISSFHYPPLPPFSKMTVNTACPTCGPTYLKSAGQMGRTALHTRNIDPPLAKQFTNTIALPWHHPDSYNHKTYKSHRFVQIARNIAPCFDKTNLPTCCPSFSPTFLPFVWSPVLLTLLPFPSSINQYLFLDLSIQSFFITPSFPLSTASLPPPPSSFLSLRLSRGLHLSLFLSICHRLDSNPMQAKLPTETQGGHISWPVSHWWSMKTAPPVVPSVSQGVDPALIQKNILYLKTFSFLFEKATI